MLHSYVGRLYFYLVELDKAEDHLLEAHRVFLESTPHRELDLAEVRILLSEVLREKGEYGGAATLVEAALVTARTAGPPGRPTLVRSLNAKASLYCYQRNAESARGPALEALQLAASVAGEHSLENAAAHINWGLVQSLESRPGRETEAEALLEDRLRVWREEIKGDHPFVALAENALGACRARAGRFQEAEELLVGSLRILEASEGERHPRVRRAKQRLAELRDLMAASSPALPNY